MDRIYRIRTEQGGRYAVERDGQFYWMNGDVFRRLRDRRRSAFRGAASVSRAGHAVDRRLHRVELQGPRRRDEQEAAGGAAGVPEAAERGDWSRRCDPAAVVGGTDRARSRNGGRHRQARVRGQGRDAMELRARHHLPQRRDRARAAGERRAVLTRQGLRHVCADRAVHRGRPRSVGARASRAG